MIKKAPLGEGGTLPETRPLCLNHTALKPNLFSLFENGTLQFSWDGVSDLSLSQKGCLIPIIALKEPYGMLPQERGLALRSHRRELNWEFAVSAFSTRKELHSFRIWRIVSTQPISEGGGTTGSPTPRIRSVLAALSTSDRRSALTLLSHQAMEESSY